MEYPVAVRVRYELHTVFALSLMAMFFCSSTSAFASLEETIEDPKADRKSPSRCTEASGEFDQVYSESKVVGKEYSLDSTQACEGM
ncbi:hypothetical protein PAAG_03238 [Paracoccidioides lutzii Pb01]|uniref:Uncharacterized protein n=1 Tax=Paracoccidioides lutzii (strain ATCC MYA-826 / Pb01) TaxID=502779 RepID=C1GXV5_PARBA|nr:hypothetical protein PAAG_03238 [Paracoccidioides lutzii Pb01]EEH41675.2 hypothetical protein PAAG_03238 [Paracoccidioides lutzii Pb01]